jgi:hypothetical protein
MYACKEACTEEHVYIFVYLGEHGLSPLPIPRIPHDVLVVKPDPVAAVQGRYLV